MKRIRNNEQLLISLTKVFYKENPAQLDELQQAIDQEDYDKVSHVVHTLKGVAANLSALKLQSILVRIEGMARENNLGSIKELIPEVLTASKELKQCFMQYSAEQNDKKSDVGSSLTQSQFNDVIQQLYEKLKKNDFIDQDELMPSSQLVNNMNGQVVVGKGLVELLIEKINQFDNDGAINIIGKIEMQQTIDSGVSKNDR